MYIKGRDLVMGEPCDSCGKKVRVEYVPVGKPIIRKGKKFWSICMDCADELEVSELFIQRPIEKEKK